MKTNNANRCTLKGYVISELKKVEKNDNAIEFTVKVPRPHEVSKSLYYDKIDCYVCDRQNVSICKNNLFKGIGVEIKGELRQWFDGTFKVLVHDVKPVY